MGYFITFLAGTAFGSIIGYLFGQSQAEEAISKLQKKVIELTNIIKKRQNEIAMHKETIEQLIKEAELIKHDRAFVTKIIFIFRRDPKISSLLDQIKSEKDIIQVLDNSNTEDTQTMEKAIHKFATDFPKEHQSLDKAAKSKVSKKK